MKQKTGSIALIAALVLVVAAFYAGKLLLPPSTYSETERRNLKPMPPLSASTVWSGSFMSDFETYTQDHFPLRDALRALKSTAQLRVWGQLDSNDLYLTQGHIVKLEYPLSTDSLDYAASRFQAVYDSFLAGTGSAVYLSIVPDKAAFLAEADGYLHMDYDALYAYMRQKLPDMTYVDVTDLLSAEDYYRTDPHWRQEQLTDVADRLLESMGAQSGFTYTPCTLTEDFKGVYAGQLALHVPAEELTVLTSTVLDGCTVYDWQNQQEIPMYNIEAATGRDGYETYLSGALPLITMENPNGEAGRELIVFRDSFGSSLAPLLVGGYEKVTLVDIRYLTPAALSAYVDFHGQDVLFLYSTLVLNNSATLK